MTATRPRFGSLITTLFLLGFSQASVAGNKYDDALPVWEIGVGIGALSFPHYPGADQSQTLVLPFPLVVYRGDTLRADRGGLKGILYDGGDTVIDVSIRGSLPVDSSDNRARSGMEDLDPTLEIGPQISWTLFKDDRNQLRFRLPFRTVISVGSGLAHEGNVFNPNLRWDHQVNSNFGFTTRASLRFGDGKWHDYFYSVNAADALPSRPEYDAPGGYSGSSLSLSGTYKTGDWRLGMALGLEWLNGAAFEDSPLVKQDSAWFVGLALSKTLFKSKRTTSTRVESDRR